VKRVIPMISFCFLLAILTIPAFAWAQGSFNMTQVGGQDIHNGYNDIWGYTVVNPGIPAQVGQELAIVGTIGGTSVVNVSDPANVVETGFIAGPNSTWRDIKTYDQWAYVVTEGGGGLQIIDLTDITAPFLAATYVGFNSAHNLYIEEATARAYICGTDSENHGVIILDLSNPVAPVQIGVWNATAVHDLFVRNNIGYLSEFSAQTFTIVDFTNAAAPTVIGGPITYPTAATHNTWTTDADDYLLTTDEAVDGHVLIWDIRNLQAITKVAEYQVATPGAIVHNLTVKNDVAYISYYTEGTRVVDLSDPVHPVEVAWFDNYTAPNTGYNGIWGIYPYLPSGRIIVSDISQGLLILEESAWGRIGGIAIDSGDSAPVFGAQVELVEAGAVITTTADGRYDVAGAPGNYTLRATSEDYALFETQIVLTEGVPATLDLNMQRLPAGPLSGTITGQTLAKALVNLEDVKIELLGYSRGAATDLAGQFSLLQVPAGPYTLRVSRAGFGRLEQQINIVEGGTVIDLTLAESPWYDNADTDTGWSLSTAGDDATTGLWQRAVPVPSAGGTVQTGADSSPGTTTGLCFVTGNAADPSLSVGANDVDAGTTTLTSPLIDLSGLSDPLMSYARWYVNEAGANPASDIFTVQVSDDDGVSWVELETLTNDAKPWTQVLFRVQDYVAVTTQFRIRFLAADDGGGSIVEAAIDDLEFYEVSYVSAVPIIPSQLTRLEGVAPNPFNPRTVIRFNLATSGRAELSVFDLRGRRVTTLVAENLAAGQHARSWDGTDKRGQTVASGVYFVALDAAGVRSTRKLLLTK
jgi:choice-of-anchor B domain-containing protein